MAGLFQKDFSILSHLPGPSMLLTTYTEFPGPLTSATRARLTPLLLREEQHQILELLAFLFVTIVAPSHLGLKYKIICEWLTLFCEKERVERRGSRE